MQKAKLFFCFLICFILTHPNTLYACRCSMTTISPSESYRRCDVVFSGVVRKIDYMNSQKRIYVDLISSWKGNLNYEIVLWTASEGPACGYYFNTNEAYLIYGYLDGDSISTDACTGSKPLNFAEEDLEFLDSLTQLRPNTALLYQNYPNPFNSITDISFVINNPGNVVLEIFDCFGQKVSELVNGFKNRGYFSIKFSTSDLSSGTYFYRLKTEGIITKKMVLLK